MAYVFKGDKAAKVKNLGWLLRNWQSITSLAWHDIKATEGIMCPDGIFTAFMQDGRVFATEYASFDVWKRFVDRPVFRGLLCNVNGIEGTI